MARPDRTRAASAAKEAKKRGERLNEDKAFRRELAAAARHAGRAVRRAQEVQGTRSHKLRNGLLLAAGAGAAATAAGTDARAKLGPMLGDLQGSLGATSVVQETIEIEVPVATAYNQWTQFEQFPQFMTGVVEVRQLDDTRLHWVASIGGRRVEWDAKIVEQHPDRQISWASEHGRTTRGTVSFEPLGEGRTLVSLSMSYRLADVRERLGSAAGLDRRRVRGRPATVQGSGREPRQRDRRLARRHQRRHDRGDAQRQPSDVDACEEGRGRLAASHTSMLLRLLVSVRLRRLALRLLRSRGARRILTAALLRFATRSQVLRRVARLLRA